MIKVEAQHYDIMQPICSALYDKECYVEIGASDGAAFNKIAPLFKRKIAVDIAPVGSYLCEGAEFYQMASDEFFAHVARTIPHISACFIDADHRKEFVLRDFYNAAELILPTNGLIFLHDTYPPSEAMINGGCWTAWEAAVEIRKLPNFEVTTLPVTCMGLTIVRYVPNKHLHWQK